MTLAKKSVSMESDLPPGGSVPAGPKRNARLTALLVTEDDTLWPLVSPHFGSDLIGKQVDTVDELVATVPSGQSAIVLWDARGATNPVALLAQLQMHSSRFAIVTIDKADRAPVWATALRQRQIAAVINLPIADSELAAAIRDAGEEAHGRLAVLGDGSADDSTGTAPSRPGRWFAASGVGLLVVTVVATVLLWPHRDATGTLKGPTSVPGAIPAILRDTQAEVEEKIDSIIDKAQQAMTARHFIEPTDGSALALYREALLLSPGNTESKQGLQRLAEILIARVNSALDERQFDVALQSLETARSIDPGDLRLGALDARMLSLRMELGPAQIQAAIAAQNFDRAIQLIDDAAKVKSLPPAKLAQLREDVRKHREQADATRFVSLADARMQQNSLIDPTRDSAAYYLSQARAAGVSASVMQTQVQEFVRRATQAAHDAIEQRHVVDADRLLTELRNVGDSPAAVASLQHDLTALRGQLAQPNPEQPPSVDLARSRLAQGNIVTPDNDSALFYWNQLRAADPKNSNVTPLAEAIQAQILVQARAALDAAQVPKADALLQQAVTLGPSSALSSLGERLTQVKMASAPEVVKAPEVSESLLTRRNQVNLIYPDSADRQNIEGWVEVHYSVMTDGKVGQIAILAASPRGIFDAAATSAIGRMRYKPYLQDGKPIVVNTAVRLVFRQSKTAGPQ